MELRDLRAYGRYAVGLRRFLRERLTAEGGRAMVARGVERRGDSFLTVLERGVYRNPSSPFLPLLRRAGVEHGDVATLLRAVGLEATLGRLHDEGVRVTLSEFNEAPSSFDNPLVGPGYPTSSSGTRNPPRRLMIDFDNLTLEAAYHSLFLSAFELWARPYAMWRPVPPVRSGMRNALGMTKLGKAPERWFSQSELEGVLARAFTRYTLAAARSIARPEHVPISDPAPIARWLAERSAANAPALLNTPASNAVRIAHAARDGGLELDGTVFRVGGEPLTDAKVAAVEATGSRAIPYYTMGEVGRVGLPCVQGEALDDVHLCLDKLALIQRDHRVADGRTVGALYLTTLVPSCPQLFLNVASDDYAVVTERDCGCPLGEAGLTTHIHSIRSYDKLTSEGMTFLGPEVFALLEDELPRRFGGRAGDYQLVEEEVDGLTKVSLLVSPGVGEVDEAAVLEAALDGLATGPQHRSIMTSVWQGANTVRIVRREPYATTAAKILPLHVRR